MPAALVLGDEAPEGSTKRMVYLVTLPHPKQAFSSTGIRLVSPGSLTKQQVLACFLDSCENPLCVHLPGEGARWRVALPVQNRILPAEHKHVHASSEVLM